MARFNIIRCEEIYITQPAYYNNVHVITLYYALYLIRTYIIYNMYL